jgi:hypothetical protein
VLQPLTERRTLRDDSTLREAIRLAESSGETHQQDPILGVSAQAIEQDPRLSVTPRD